MFTIRKNLLHAILAMVAFGCLTLASDAQLIKKKNPPTKNSPANISEPMPIPPEGKQGPPPQPFTPAVPPTVSTQPMFRPNPTSTKKQPKVPFDANARAAQNAADFLARKATMDALLNANSSSSFATQMSPYAQYNPYTANNNFYNQFPNTNPYMSNPMTNPYMSNPMMNPYMSNPMTNPYMSNPMMNPYMSNPMMNPYMSNPMTNPMMNPYMSNPMMNPYQNQLSPYNPWTQPMNPFNQPNPWQYNPAMMPGVGIFGGRM